MKLIRKFTLVFGLATLGATLAQPALAHGHGHGRVVVGIGFGGPYWGGRGWGYPGPYYYPYSYPYPAYVPSQPATYIQQEVAPAAPASATPQGYWYYCSDAQAYYPYVKECPGGWQRVSPQPAR